MFDLLAHIELQSWVDAALEGTINGPGAWDGYTASRRIRESEPPGVRVPIIAMTANSVADIRASCIEAGMNDFLSKPVAPERLFVTLLTWMQTVLKS